MAGVMTDSPMLDKTLLSHVKNGWGKVVAGLPFKQKGNV
jgi:hypothetical protein